MKKVILFVTALILIVAMAVPSIAEYKTLYVNKSKLNAYKEPNKDSKVLKKLKGGHEVLVDTTSGVSEDGKWYYAYNPEDGDGYGWLLAKHLTDKMPSKYCKHDWSEWKDTTPATCTTKGERTRECSICHKTQTKEIKKLGHTFSEWKTIKEPESCDKPGEESRTCSVCDFVEVRDKIKPHTFGEWSIIKEATCSSKGKRTRKCKVCNTEEQEELPKLDHNYEWNIISEATDHSSGTRQQVCQICGHAEPAVSYDPDGTLRRGDKGEDVRAFQQLLIDQGYLAAGGADGSFGSGTEKAVMQFQKDQGLTADGVIWPQTRQLMDHDFGPWTITKAMTRTEPGERVRVCNDCGYEQREPLEAGTTWIKGARGESVRALQQLLGALGYNPGKSDGAYGKKLDTAFSAFAKDKGFVFEPGKIRPADVDALMNAWLEDLDDEKWMGEGSADSAVSLSLTVIPVEDVQDETGEMRTFSWNVTNLGSESCHFNALLLTFGNEADFREDNLTIEVDGFELMPMGTNNKSGTFVVASDWGEGDLNFAAMAVTDPDGSVWISNAVSFGNGETPEPKTVEPQDVVYNVDDLQDGIYPVAFNRGDILTGASGVFMNAVHIYTRDIYDIVDINTLAEGDTVVIGGVSHAVETIQVVDGYVIVNGGNDQENGFEFVSEEESNCYRVNQYDDLATYTEQGVTSLTLSATAVYTDASDIDSEPVTVEYGNIPDAMMESENESFDPYNTTVRVENGEVVEINRVYVP